MFKRLRNRLRLLSPLRALRRALVTLANRRRRRYTDLDTIILNLPDSMPALPESRSWLRKRLQGPAPLSLYDFDKIMRQIADDPRPKRIVLVVRGLALSLADLQTLRGSIQRLRAAGKRVICYGQHYGLGQYYLASACDEILLQPGSELATIGLREEAVFLRDALDAVGVGLDVVAISPYKGAFDRLTHSTISPEGRAQLEWLLDSRYEMIVGAIAEGRGWTVEQARQMIDTAPHTGERAKELGYMDGVLNEEDLPRHLNVKKPLTWAQARRRLLLKMPVYADKAVMLLPISGMMVMGESANPPGNIPLPVPFVGGERAGDRTVVRQARNLLKRDDVGAVVLYIDSPGGAAIAAEAMTAALDELAKTRPLVVFMNRVAASGGYYIATAARWIVAQPGTITGSIGVVTAKPITGGLFERAKVNTLEFTRGANASLYSTQEPFTDAQRAQIRASIEHIYGLFLRRVAVSRKMSESAVDVVGGGRVWTGKQAHAVNLVDELGDLHTAIRKARQLANMPDDTPVIFWEGKAKPLPPQLVEQVNPAASLAYLHESARLLFSGTAQLVMDVWWKDTP